MRITLINLSDSVGGAAVASQRLMQALRGAGHDARMLVSQKTTTDPNILEVGWGPRKKFNFLAERATIYRRKGIEREDLFKVSVANTGTPLHNHPWVREADVVVLNWINQGMMSLHNVEAIARRKPTVWVMHDMWCMTGACHHAYSCDRYLDRCGKCPLMGRRQFRDLSFATWMRKQRVYERTGLQFVAVSNWLRDKASHSSLMGHMPIPVIPNAFPMDEYPALPYFSREQMRLPLDDTPVISMGALRLDDPLKGLPIAIEALNMVHDKGMKAHVALYGGLKNSDAIKGLRMPYTYYGQIGDQPTIQSLYANSTVALSTSLYETQGLTLIEGMACGCTPVTFAQDGRADFVIDGQTGYVARYRDPVSVARAIERALCVPLPRPDQRRAIADRFAAPIVAAAHIDLYNTLITPQKH